MHQVPPGIVRVIYKMMDKFDIIYVFLFFLNRGTIELIKIARGLSSSCTRTGHVPMAHSFWHHSSWLKNLFKENIHCKH